ncbi:alpha/beta fold hydrolase [Calidifontibacter indicus]|uniref:alpha/beta fold hydrolase n=1 Tax=Calidifontibacter indicus TaxID=419650 RepID=UPI003D763B51
MDLHEDDIRLPERRVLHAYVAVPAGRVALTLYWHHGSPNIGQPPVPLLPLADELGIRFVSHTRPGYTGSDRARDRRVVDVAPDAATVLDHLGVERFVSMGHSGGGSHSLALAARDPRCVGALAISGLAPIDAEGLDFVDDDVAATHPWGFDPAGVGVPTVLLHGARDRMVPADHSRWLAGVIPDADLRVVDAGHLSVMRFVEPAIRDLLSRLA